MNKPQVFIKYSPIVLTPEDLEAKKSRDIIVKQISYEIDYDEQGNEIKKRKVKKVNLTKKINETKKLVKNDQAQKKLEEIEAIFTK